MLTPLYKLDSSGNLRVWEIDVQIIAEEAYGEASVVFVRHGVLGGKIQEDEEHFTEGKNIGKANATNAYQQACSEAISKWKKQIEQKGYVVSKERALAKETDVPGPTAMLAHPLVDREGKIKKNNLKKLVWPLAVQPKLDGMRCLAVINEGKVKLYSRRGKPITAVPHIETALSEAYPTGLWQIDGELYNHAFKSDFESLISICKTQKGIDGQRLIQYHIYDCILEELGFLERFSIVEDTSRRKSPYLVLVDTRIAETLEAAKEHLENFLEEGYEGLMLRNIDSIYDNEVTRSYNLQKYKLFQEEEFDIVDVKEGKGRMKGLAIFVCSTKEGNDFNVKLEGKLENLKQYWEDETTWKNKKLTVCFQKYSNKNNVPVFPTGKAVRDYE